MPKYVALLECNHAQGPLYPRSYDGPVPKEGEMVQCRHADCRPEIGPAPERRVVGVVTNEDEKDPRGRDYGWV
jgi:hypothetical protein